MEKSMVMEVTICPILDKWWGHKDYCNQKIVQKF